MKHLAKSVAVLLLVGTACFHSQAAIITSAAGMASPTIVDFSQFSDGYLFTGGPVQVGGLVGEDIIFSSTNTDAVLGEGGYGLGDNGSWGNFGQKHSGLNIDAGTMTFTFNSGPVSQVGGFINYSSGDSPNVVIEALAIDGVTILESYDITSLAPISTPDGINEGAFRGIRRLTADIGAFRLSNSYVVLDDLTFKRDVAVTPEPASLAIWGGIGIAGLVAGWHRKRAIAPKAKT